MKTYYLKKLRKQVGVFLEKTTKPIVDSETREAIEGRFCVYNPFTRIWHYDISKERILKQRRIIILKHAEQLRKDKTGSTKKRIDI